MSNGHDGPGGHWTDGLVRLRACGDAVDWAKGFGSLDAAWAACDRGDWMLWLAGRVSGAPGGDARRTLVLAACGCACGKYFLETTHAEPRKEW
ncbi:MAG: hypothetical protein AAF235_05475 [Planctomycetota bacterium]